MRSRQKWIDEAGELYAILSQKNQSTYLHNSGTKLDITDSKSSVSVSVSLSLLSLPVTSYMHKHTTRGRLEVGSVYVKQE
jgi:hypothetical protein